MEFLHFKLLQQVYMNTINFSILYIITSHGYLINSNCFLIDVYFRVPIPTKPCINNDFCLHICEDIIPALHVCVCTNSDDCGHYCFFFNIYLMFMELSL